MGSVALLSMVEFLRAKRPSKSLPRRRSSSLRNGTHCPFLICLYSTFYDFSTRIFIRVLSQNVTGAFIRCVFKSAKFHQKHLLYFVPFAVLHVLFYNL